MGSRARSTSPSELLYLKATIHPTLAETETKHIASRALKQMQEECKTLRQLMPSVSPEPLVLKLPKERFDPNLTCFLATKATNAYKRALRPRFSDDGELLVKVYASPTERKHRRKRTRLQYPQSYLQQLGVVESTGLSMTAKDKATLHRLRESLNQSLQREYLKEKREKSYLERCRELRLMAKPL